MSNQDFLFNRSTIYPFNHVYQTESGHFTEFDDNKGSERITINHRTGTHIEFHPNADFSHTVLGSMFTSIYADNLTHVWGAKTLTVNKELKLIVSGETIEKETEGQSYNLDIEVGKGSHLNIIIRKGNCNIILEEGDVNLLSKKGDMNIRQENGDYKHYVNGNYRLDVTGQMDVIVGQNYVSNIQGSRFVQVDGELDYLNMTNSNAHLETWGNKQCTRMQSDIYMSSANFVSRSDDQTILETGSGSVGEFTIMSSGNINISSGWDPVAQGISLHPEPRLNLFSYKSSQGGDVCIFTGNEFNLVSSQDTKFDIRGGNFHVKVDNLKKNWSESSSPEDALQQNFIIIYEKNYLKIDYDKIMNAGFEEITIPKITKQ
jgi:hypothetical protein